MANWVSAYSGTGPYLSVGPYYNEHTVQTAKRVKMHLAKIEIPFVERKS